MKLPNEDFTNFINTIMDEAVKKSQTTVSPQDFMDALWKYVHDRRAKENDGDATSATEAFDDAMPENMPYSATAQRVFGPLISRVYQEGRKNGLCEMDDAHSDYYGATHVNYGTEEKMQPSEAKKNLENLREEYLQTNSY